MRSRSTASLAPRLCSSAIVVAVVCLAAAQTAAALGVVRPGSSFRHFWDEYAAYRDLWRESADSASVVSARLLRDDPDHLLASWLRGRLLTGAAGDSAGATRLLAQAARAPRAAGLQVTAATVLCERKEMAQGRAALDRAHAAYLAAGRRQDACRALLWKLVLQRGAQVDSAVTRDMQAAEAAARELGEPEVLADVLLVRAEMEYRQSAQAALRTRTEALALLSQLPPGYQLIECHRHLSNAYKTLGQLATARHHAEHGLAMARALDSRRQEMLALRAVAHVDRAEGALERARELQTQAAAMVRALREDEILARCCGDLGNLARDMGRYQEAKKAYAEGLQCGGALRADPGTENT